ncbi:MAG: hypothetical protein ACRD6W_08600, partial [Nitrososphaerales archaeon]
VVVVAFCLLRELSPQLRNQLIVSEQERALVEARAMGIDVEKATAHPLRSMIRIDLIASSFGVAVLLLFYYVSVSVLTIYWVVVFNRSTPDADSINVWYAAFLSGALVVFGAVSDRLRVRKPLMLLGAAGAIVMMVFLSLQASRPHTGYYSNVTVIVLLAMAISCAYCPWMAGYTEQVESHNPAFAASGLAVWGWILRVVVAVSFLVLPHVITTSTTLVDNQDAATSLQAVKAAVPYAPTTSPAACAPRNAPAPVVSALEATKEPGPSTLAKVITGCDKTHNLLKALATAGGLTNPQVLGLLAYSPLATAIENGHPVTDSEIASKVGIHSKDLASLLQAEKKLVPAQKASPNQWKRWWLICIGGMAVFLVLVFFMRGRWSPRAARRDLEEHDRLVAEELAKIRREMAPAGVGDLPSDDQPMPAR